MKTIGCRDIHREIEEAGPADSLSLVANDHLKNCAACETFYTKQFKLQQILSSLGTVEAPGDFDFRLRARLAGEKRGTRLPLTTGNFSFGFRAAAFAAVPLLIGAALLVVSLRPEPNNSLVANGSADEAKLQATQPEPIAPLPGGEKTAVRDPVGQVPPAGSSSKPGAVRGGNRVAGRRGPVATEAALAGNDRVKIREMDSTQAKVFKPGDLVADAGHSVFPIEASSQSLKVSVDNGRGSSKTISLPGVSFGSQRVLTESAPPLLATARGAW